MIELAREDAQNFILNQNWLRTEKDNIPALQAVKQIHNVQIDTISVIARAHDLTMFNRAQKYQEKDIWNLLKEKKLLESWSHSMCLVPVEEYPYYLWRIEYNRDHMHSWWREWEKKSKSIIEEVYNYVKKNGPTKSADFKSEEKRDNAGWWSWKDEKSALEILFLTGRLLISHRENFQRYYDIPERVLPSKIENEKLSREELPFHHISIIFASLGIASYEEIKHYTGQMFYRLLWQNKLQKLEKFLDDCVVDDILQEVKIKGVERKHYILTEKITDLEKSRKLVLKNSYVKFLSPFDNIIRERSFPQRLWNFEYKLEAYTPPDKRQFGYYSLPILDKTSFVGITDMKAFRKEKKLVLNSIFFNDGQNFDDEFSARFVAGLKLFSNFHDCEEIVVNYCNNEKIAEEIKDQLNG